MQTSTQLVMKLLPKPGSEPNIPVRNHGDWHSVPSHHLSNIDISQILGLYALLDRNKIGTLGQPIHDDPYGVHSQRGPGKLGDEIHSNIFPFPHGNV